MTKEKKYMRIVLGLVVFYILIIILSDIVSKTRQYDLNLLDNQMKCTVTNEDGTVSTYDSNKFSNLSRGDTLDAVITLPKEYQTEKYMSLCIQTYNCVISVVYQGELLYQYGDEYDKKGQMIGAIYARVPLPPEAFGNQVEVRCDVKEDKSFDHLMSVTLMPTTESGKFYLIGKTPSFLLFTTLFCLAGILFFILIFNDLRKVEIREGICLALFGQMVAFYMMAYNGYINIYSSNMHMNGILEYGVLFFVPVPIMAYFAQWVRSKQLQRNLWILSGIYMLIGIVCLILNSTTKNYHYSVILPFYHILIAVGMIFLIISCYIEKYHFYHRGMIAEQGFMIFFIIAIVEIIRYNIDKYMNLPFALTNITLLPIGILIFLLLLVLDVAKHMYETNQEVQEKHQLEVVAYKDILTGLWNRAGYEKYIAQMTDENTQEYVLIYMDLNNLKTTNDVYGHESGDIYIKESAKIFHKYFHDADMCSRIGGDEFVVIYKGKFHRRINGLLQEIKREFQKNNDQGIYQFTMSVACGYVFSTSQAPLLPKNAINLADQEMYKDKKTMKKAQ